MGDMSFDDNCAFGSERWCAVTLGKPLDWLYRNRPMLEADGFPAKDRLLGRTNKADVQVWIDRRRRLSDAGRSANPEPRENFDAL